MDFDVLTIILLIIFGFLGAFVDAIVGGGGLVTLPALLSIGIPPTFALGTNKFASTMGSFMSVMTYLRAGKINLKFALPILPFILIFSMAGAKAVHYVPNEILRPLVIIMLILVLIYTLMKKDWGQLEKASELSMLKKSILILLIVAIGFYDGFFGPGTGSFFIFVILMYGLDFLKASGNAKIFNFMSNFGALIMFLYLGNVLFLYGLIMGVSMICGAYVGSKFALRGGTKFVRIFFIIITSVLIVKNIMDLL